MHGENKYNFDYAVHKKPEGQYKTKRTLVVLSYILIPCIIIAILSTFISYFAFVMVPVIVILARPLINATWRYVNYDQRYEIMNAGTMRFTHYYGKKFRTDKNDEHADEHIAEKLILEMKIKDFDAIAPYNDDTYRRAFDAENITNVINHCSSESAPNVYYGIFKNESGEKSAILFDMVERSLDIISYYNRDTVKIELHYAGEDLGK